MVKLLMLNNADPNIVPNDELEQTTMYWAADNGNVSIIKLLLNDENKYNINNIFNWDKLINYGTKDTNDTIFHILCRNGNLDCIKYLLSIENKLNSSTNIDWFKKDKIEEMTPLLKAFKSNETETIIYLLNNVYSKQTQLLFDINNCDHLGRTPLWFACLHGNMLLIETMFNLFGNDINLIINKCDNNGMSPLYIGILCCVLF